MHVGHKYTRHLNLSLTVSFVKCFYACHWSLSQLIHVEGISGALNICATNQFCSKYINHTPDRALLSHAVFQGKEHALTRLLLDDKVLPMNHVPLITNYYGFSKAVG